jgi:hypothetical protein
MRPPGTGTPCEFHVAGIVLEPGDFFVRHYRTQPRFAAHEQHRAVNHLHDMFILIACGEALAIVEQGIEEGGVELPQASCKEQYPRAGYARVILAGVCQCQSEFLFRMRRFLNSTLSH